MSQHEAMADRLVSIIQSIQLAQGNGVLTVRRGEGGALEEGTIVFVNGQVAQATVGWRTGSGALNRLSTWDKCRYVFTTSNGMAQSLPSTPPPDLDKELPAISNAHPRLRDPLVEKPADVSNNPTGPLARPPELLKTVRGQTLFLPPALVTLSTIQPMHAALRRIEQFSLTRLHRQLFLLIDGQRSFEEIVRLVGKSQGEVYKLLCDLKSIGVIHIGGD